MKSSAAPSADVLLDALIHAALRACVGARDLVWATHYDTPERAAIATTARDRAVRSVEHLLVYASGHAVIADAGARRLAGIVYDALAAECRDVAGRRFPDEPQGHWQRVDAITRRLRAAWRVERIKNVARSWIPPHRGAKT